MPGGGALPFSDQKWMKFSTLEIRMRRLPYWHAVEKLYSSTRISPVWRYTAAT
jgi:hypothetical protein